MGGPVRGSSRPSRRAGGGAGAGLWTARSGTVCPPDSVGSVAACSVRRHSLVAPLQNLTCPPTHPPKLQSLPRVFARAGAARPAPGNGAATARRRRAVVRSCAVLAPEYKTPSESPKLRPSLRPSLHPRLQPRLHPSLNLDEELPDASPRRAASHPSLRPSLSESASGCSTTEAASSETSRSASAWYAMHTIPLREGGGGGEREKTGERARG